MRYRFLMICVSILSLELCQFIILAEIMAISAKEKLTLSMDFEEIR